MNVRVDGVAERLGGPVEDKEGTQKHEEREFVSLRCIAWTRDMLIAGEQSDRVENDEVKHTLQSNVKGQSGQASSWNEDFDVSPVWKRNMFS